MPNTSHDAGKVVPDLEKTSAFYKLLREGAFIRLILVKRL